MNDDDPIEFRLDKQETRLSDDSSGSSTSQHEVLGSNSEFLRLLVAQVKEYAIFILDTQGVVTTWNLGAERIKGYKAEEIIGKHFSVFYSTAAKDNGHPAFELEQALNEGSYQEEGWRVRKDGSRFWAHAVITPLRNEQGLHIGFAKVTRDMTEQKDATDRLHKLMQQREDFVATLTHDLKTPVFAAIRAINLLLDGDFGPVLSEQREVLSTIVDSNELMYRLLLTLLDVYRYDSGQKELAIDMHDLTASVKKLVDEVQPIALTRKITVAKIAPNNEPALVPCDADEIRRVLQNLVDNALKFTPAGGQIEISIQQSDNLATVSVTDTGKGIPETDNPKLFERFWTATESGRVYASTGLGLYLCRKIVESHGGKIWCESVLGKGSTFSFTLPLSQKQESTAE
jgi:PAS domain S-box-containing protein